MIQVVKENLRKFAHSLNFFSLSREHSQPKKQKIGRVLLDVPPNALTPITKLTPQMHNRSHENVRIFDRINNAVGKLPHQTSPKTTTDLAPAQRSAR
jgi:hypothetical protein